MRQGRKRQETGQDSGSCSYIAQSSANQGEHFCRQKRPGEVDGVDYWFVSKEEFESWIQNGRLLEHAVVYGEYKGIPLDQVRAYCQHSNANQHFRVFLIRKLTSEGDTTNLHGPPTSERIKASFAAIICVLLGLQE